MEWPLRGDSQGGGLSECLEWNKGRVGGWKVCDDVWWLILIIPFLSIWCLVGARKCKRPPEWSRGQEHQIQQRPFFCRVSAAGYTGTTVATCLSFNLKKAEPSDRLINSLDNQLILGHFLSTKWQKITPLSFQCEDCYFFLFYNMVIWF